MSEKPAEKPEEPARRVTRTALREIQRAHHHDAGRDRPRVLVEQGRLERQNPYGPDTQLTTRAFCSAEKYSSAAMWPLRPAYAAA